MPHPPFSHQRQLDLRDRIKALAPGRGLSEEGEGGERPVASEAARKVLFSFAVCQVAAFDYSTVDCLNLEMRTSDSTSFKLCCVCPSCVCERARSHACRSRACVLQRSVIRPLGRVGMVCACAGLRMAAGTAGAGYATLGPAAHAADAEHHSAPPQATRDPRAGVSSYVLSWYGGTILIEFPAVVPASCPGASREMGCVQR